MYKIRAIFGGMVKLDQQTSPPKQGGSAEKQQSALGVTGISIEFFTKNCPFLMMALPDISRRVLIAVGKYTHISLLQCYFRSGRK